MERRNEADECPVSTSRSAHPLSQPFTEGVRMIRTDTKTPAVHTNASAHHSRARSDEKRATLPEKWFKGKNNRYLQLHFIPNDSELLDILNFEDFIGAHTILYGEANTKKTYYTAKFVQYLINIKKINPKEISILDFAPQLGNIRGLKIGGKIEDFFPQSIRCNNISFEGEIIPPRLNANNKKELHQYAQMNYEKTFEILEIYNKEPTSILIINDISIFLHLGNKKYILNTIKQTSTFFGNTYYGSSIKRNFATIFSIKEKRSVKFLLKRVDKAFITQG